MNDKIVAIVGMCGSGKSERTALFCAVPTKRKEIIYVLPLQVGFVSLKHTVNCVYCNYVYVRFSRCGPDP